MTACRTRHHLTMQVAHSRREKQMGNGLSASAISKTGSQRQAYACSYFPAALMRPTNPHHAVAVPAPSWTVPMMKEDCKQLEGCSERRA